MKKLSYLIILALILGLVLTGCSLLSNVGQVPATEQKGMPFPIAANLVALWHFDENSGITAYDSTVNSNNGTVNGANWVDGKLGKALSFDDVSDYVNCGDDVSFDFVDKFTVEAWINLNVIPGYYDIIVNRAYGNWMVAVYDGKLMFGEYHWQGLWSRHIYSDVVPWTTGQWYHVAVVYDTIGKTADFYLDGVPIGNGRQSTDKYGIINSGIVGISSYIGATGFNGTIDEVRIWDGALTAEEIFYSYNDETLHVDDDWVQWPGAYKTINEALAVAVDDDIIIVHEGTYTENVVVSKSVTLFGANYDIDPAGSTADRGDGESIIDGMVKITADNVTVNGFKMTSNSYIEISDAYNTALKANVSYNILENTAWADGAVDLNGGNRCDGSYIGYNTISGTSKYGIKTIQNDDVTIECNHILNTGFTAIDAGYHLGTGIVIHGNTITTSGGKGINYWAEDGGVITDNVITNSTHEAIFTDVQVTINGNQISGCGGYGIQVYWGAGGSTISDNIISGTSAEGINAIESVTITNNNISGGYQGIQIWAATGTLIDGNDIHDNEYWGLSIQYGVTDATVENNQFTNNPYCGVIVWGDGEGSGIHINSNNITGNGIYGVESKRTTSDVDATCNWWGDFSGPSGAGTGLGDAVSENVDFSPWLLDPAPDGKCGIKVEIDIKPQSCPNPLNIKNQGVLPVAILGTLDFDVTKVNPSTILLQGAPLLRWAFEDVATPSENLINVTVPDCSLCTDVGPDGYTDLTLKFDTQAILDKLGLGTTVLVEEIEVTINNGDCLVLTLTGELNDGTPIMGKDVVLIIKKGK